jgi:DNA polymerase phi
MLTYSGEDQGASARRTWVIDQLASLVRNGAVPKGDAWITSVLDWLVVHGLFDIKKKSKDSPYQAVSCEVFTSDLLLMQV